MSLASYRAAPPRDNLCFLSRPHTTFRSATSKPLIPVCSGGLYGRFPKALFEYRPAEPKCQGGEGRDRKRMFVMNLPPGSAKNPAASKNLLILEQAI